MDIDKTDTQTHEPMLIDEEEKLIRSDGESDGESLQQIQDSISVFEIAAGQFPDDIRMASHLTIEQQCFEPAVARAQMIDPDGSIDEDHS